MVNMKHLVGFVVALILVAALSYLNKHCLCFKIPQFLVGWLSCVGYTASRDIYDAVRRGS